MNTFIISEPVASEPNFEGSLDVINMMDNFSEFLKSCGYEFDGIEFYPGSNVNCVLSVKAGDELYLIEGIIGKKYLRLMDKRLSPVVTSQLTYGKNLNYEKYKNNMDSIISSIKGFKNINDRLVEIIGLIRDDVDKAKYAELEEKFGIDEINVMGKNVFLTKHIEASEITVMITEHAGKFNFSVKYPEKEVFSILDNFLPENGFEPKMNGINNRIAEYNRIAGEIIQKIVTNEKDVEPKTESVR